MAEINNAKDDFDDTINAKDSEFVGIVLDGTNMIDGELTVDTACTFEEPRVVADEDEEPDESALRELWGDGDPNPDEASE